MSAPHQPRQPGQRHPCQFAGKMRSWGELGRMVAASEGWQFKLALRRRQFQVEVQGARSPCLLSQCQHRFAEWAWARHHHGGKFVEKRGELGSCRSCKRPFKSTTHYESTVHLNPDTPELKEPNAPLKAA